MKLPKPKEVLETYKETNSSIRNKITTLSLAVIASLFLLIDKNLGVKDNLILYKLSFLACVLALIFDFASLTLKSLHLADYMDGKIERIGVKHSKKGKWADICFWCMVSSFLLGGFLFIIAILLLRDTSHFIF